MYVDEQAENHYCLRNIPYLLCLVQYAGYFPHNRAEHHQLISYNKSSVQFGLEVDQSQKHQSGLLSLSRNKAPVLTLFNADTNATLTAHSLMTHIKVDSSQ